MRRGFVCSFLFALAAAPSFAGYASRDLVLPVAGHATGSDGRAFETELWLTNTAPETTTLTLTFFTNGKNIALPHRSSLQLQPNETRFLPTLNNDILGVPAAIGALRIESTTPLIADAQLASRLATEPAARAVATSFSAIPRQFAIGTGQSTLLHGVTLHDPYRYRLYAAEITGQPLLFAVALLDANGKELARRQLYVNAWEQLAASIDDEMTGVKGTPAVLQISGVNGAGRIALVGLRTASDSHDATAFEMSFTTEPRNRVPWWEAFVYIAAAAAIIFVVVLRKR